MANEFEIPKISLKAARVNANLSQQQAAKELGVDVSTVIRWEKDPAKVQAGYQSKISKTYKYPVNYIFFGN